jgi:O-acetyl-ADP-ribose deacetylase (regulator of RNase III)
VRYGDILNDTRASYIVNPVNCVGVMGAGLALAYKKKFGDEYFRAYVKDCALGNLVPGTATTWWTDRRLPDGSLQRVINFPTKRHWRDRSNVTDIANSCRFIHREILLPGQSIALPMLGCGLGGLQWTDVRPAIIEAFDGFVDTECYFYETAGVDTKARAR